MHKFRTMIALAAFAALLIASFSTVHWRARKGSPIRPATKSHESVDDRSAAATRREEVDAVQIYVTAEDSAAPIVPAPSPALDGIHGGMKADEWEHRQRMHRALLRGPKSGIEPID